MKVAIYIANNNDVTLWMLADDWLYMYAVEVV